MATYGMSLLHAGHGKGAGQPHVELPKLSDLPAGMPAPARIDTPQAPVGDAGDRLPTGQLQAGTATARDLARKGGLAKAAKAKREAEAVRVLDCLGLRGQPASD